MTRRLVYSSSNTSARGTMSKKRTHILDSNIKRQKNCSRKHSYTTWIFYTNIEELVDRINTNLNVFGVENKIEEMPDLRINNLTRKISFYILEGMRLNFSPGLR